MNRNIPVSFWVEAGFGFASAALLALTLVLPDWIETILGVAPDGGDGSSEWGLAAALVVATLMLFVLAGWTWKRSQPLSTDA